MYRKSEVTIDFDFAKVTEQSKDNPVFYVQYAHARTASIFRQAASEMPNLSVGLEDLAKADLSAINDDLELALIRKLVRISAYSGGGSRNTRASQGRVLPL